MLQRLSVVQRGPTDKIRVSILERRTKFRNVENQKELVALLRRDPDLDVNVVYYSTQVENVEKYCDVPIQLSRALVSHMT